VNEWNQTAARITGFHKAEVLERNLVNDFITDDYKAAVKEVLDKALRGEETSNYEFPLFTKAGDQLHLLLNATSRRTKDQVILGVIGIGQDITERKATERMKAEFVSVVSHELRTPLSSISGSLKLLEQGLAGPLPKEAEELTLIASRNCGRLIRLVNDILDLEKFHAGMVKLRVNSANLFEIIEKACAAVSGLATAGQVSVSLPKRIDQRLEVDEDRIVQVLTNLLGNAIQFTPAGGKIHIEHTELESGAHRIAVRDFGEGVKPTEHSMIFDKFRQLDSSDSRAKGGTGLGLAICKSIVDQHGGQIGVENPADGGARFWFVLPSGRDLVTKPSVP
ncbi:MAG: PAS domain-containing sensor histidine kinase, partial [Candidatus Binatia bacterium]|nr:PAS domain-containing sensor histidine kinase [Candidatus Binatia bacterium]